MSRTAGETSSPGRQDVDVTGQVWGSDLIADLLKALGFPFVSFNPGASFRAIEESIVNYNDNSPRVVEAPHEELALAAAHGYARATDEPAVAILHDTVGTLHGAMNLYRAYTARVPMLVLAGNGPLRKSRRRPWIDWNHSVLTHEGLIGQYVKWYDQPAAIDGVASSIVRAARIANTPPKGPTFVTIDAEIQEQPLERPIEIPRLSKFRPPTRQAPDPEAVEAAADLLVEADRPTILVDRVGRSREAVEFLVELADLLGSPVIDGNNDYFNFPYTHPMNHAGMGSLEEADVLLALDVVSLQQKLSPGADREDEPRLAPPEGVDLVSVGMHDLEASSLFTDYYAMYEIDLPIQADTGLALPLLVEAVRERLEGDPGRREVAEDRFARMAERHRDHRERWQEEMEDAWDEEPISIPRLVGELWDVIEGEEWVVVNGKLRGWPHRLWDIEEFDQLVGGAGIGYGMGGAVGGALAYAETDRVPINLQPDGDLMYYLDAFWMMSHYDLPVLSVVHNNRSYFNSTDHRMRLAEARGRDSSFERALIGTGLWDPVPDYAAIAEGLGVSGYGPIEDPDDLGDALSAAWADVAAGRPAVVDVVSQPR